MKTIQLPTPHGDLDPKDVLSVIVSRTTPGGPGVDLGQMRHLLRVLDALACLEGEHLSLDDEAYTALKTQYEQARFLAVDRMFIELADAIAAAR